MNVFNKQKLQIVVILVSYFFLSTSRHLYLYSIDPCMTAHGPQEPTFTTSAVSPIGQIGSVTKKTGGTKNLNHSE